MPITRRRLIAGSLGIPTATILRHSSAQESPWTLLDDAGGPIARWDHALLPDADGARLFLFGGRDGAGAALDDLWVYDLAGSGWHLVERAGPAPRFGVVAAQMPGGGGFLLFGGQSADIFYNDLWHFDVETLTWTMLDDGSGIAPSPRYGLGGDFDASDRFVVSHGFTFEGRFDDTWAFDPAAGVWNDISPAPETRPLRRCLHEMTALGQGDRLLLYAGCSSGYGPCPQGDLWSFDSDADTWSQLAPVTSPAARSNPAVARSADGILLVGGLTESGPAADVWMGSLNGATFEWVEHVESGNVIAPRSSHDLVTIDGSHLLFGGLGSNGPLADLWRYTTIR